MSPSIQSTIFFSVFLALTTATPLPTSQNSNILLPRALNPSCAPGGNFDLSKFTLQLPTGSAGKVDSVSGSKLAGCKGWSSDKYFYTDKSDGALVMKVPGSSTSSGCVTTPNSKHCRTELRESSPSSWDPTKSTNHLRAELVVKTADDSKYGTVIGQVKVDDKVSKKPLAELFVNKSGTVTIGVSQIPDVSSLKMTEVGKVKIGEKFSYELRYEKGVLSVVINGGAAKTLSTGSIKSPLVYFKAGNYNQGNSPSEVRLYSLDIQH